MRIPDSNSIRLDDLGEAKNATGHVNRTLWDNNKMLKLSLSLLLLLGFAASAEPNVTFNGSVQDCFAGQPTKVGGVNISAFDASQNVEMLDSLKAMDQGGPFVARDTTYMTRFGSQFNRVMELAASSTPLAQSTSDADGSFTLSAIPVDSVVILGSRKREDEQFFYSYILTGGRSNRSVVLDMSRGDCAQ